MSDALRPERLDDFTGQSKVTRHLEIILGAANSRKELPDHILLSGPPGTGKTTLAGIIANELGVGLVSTSGPAIEKPGEIASLLSSLREPSVLFIDEIHRLDIASEEMLYPAMEDGVIDIVVGEGAKTRSLRLPIEPTCVVGATTQSGLLSAPLRSRFGFQTRLSLYDVDELSAVISRSASLLEFNISEDGAALIASRSRGTPRIANALLRRVRDVATVEGHDVTDAEAASAALEAFGIDSLGLDDMSNEYLRTLCTTFGGGPVGARTIASSIGEAEATAVEVIEPFLLRCGLVARTPRGRVATPEGFQHAGLAVPGGAWAESLQLNLDTDSDS